MRAMHSFFFMLAWLACACHCRRWVRRHPRSITHKHKQAVEIEPDTDLLFLSRLDPPKRLSTDPWRRLATLLLAYAPAHVFTFRTTRHSLKARQIHMEGTIKPERGGMPEEISKLLVHPTDGVLRWEDGIREAAAKLVPAYNLLRQDQFMVNLLKESSDYLLNCSSYLHSMSAPQIHLALEVAFVAHFGQKRRSGEPYVTHPVEVAAILCQSRMDLASVVSGLLHDVVEDTVMTFDDIDILFGEDVTRIVEGETKVSKLPKMVRKQLDDKGEPLIGTIEDDQSENLRSMFIAMSEDWRIVVVKLADRLHNMRTLMHMPRKKQVSISRETLDILVPIAHRLGLWQYKTELSDLCFRYLHPSEHGEMSQYMQLNSERHEQTMTKAKQRLESLLLQDPILQDAYRIDKVSVSGRTKCMYSTWKKMQRQACGIQEVKDLLAVRVVLNGDLDNDTNQNTCKYAIYHVLSQVSSLWPTLPGTTKDYISMPKPNGYKSLHTTVLAGSIPLEVQIRTQKMHDFAEFGAAAHWLYKDQDSQALMPWVQVVKRAREQAKCAQEFVRLVREELQSTRMYVFTRNGSILNLNSGTTAEEAAQMLGMPWDSCKVLVNGIAVRQRSDLLTNGDIITFDTLDRSDPETNQSDFEESLVASEAFNLSEPKIVKGALQWERCQQCLPVRGDRLCTAVSPVQTTPVTLHRIQECECFIMSRHRAQGRKVCNHAVYGRFDPATALGQFYDDGFTSDIVVFVKDRKWILTNVSAVVTKLANSILSVYSETRARNEEAFLQYSLTVEDVSQLENLMKEVATVQGVVHVLRDNAKNLMQESPETFWQRCQEPSSSSELRSPDSQ